MGESFNVSKSQSQTAGIGCGSLIVTVIVVSLVTQGSKNPTREEVAGIKNDVAELKKVVEAQSSQIRSLSEALSKQQPAPPK